MGLGTEGWGLRAGGWGLGGLGLRAGDVSMIGNHGHSVREEAEGRLLCDTDICCCSCLPLIELGELGAGLLSALALSLQTKLHPAGGSLSTQLSPIASN